jgi:two-component sensor histidine kinase
MVAADEGEVALQSPLENTQDALARLLLDSESARLPALLQLTDLGPGLIFVTDADGRTSKPGSGNLAGVNWAEDNSWIDAVHPEDRPGLPMGGNPDGTEPHQRELRIRDESGEWRWHRLRAVPVRGGQGRIVEWVGMLHDVHTRKVAAEKRDLLVDELRHRLKNLVAIIEALAKYSAPRPGKEPVIDAFMKRFLGRLHALTAASDLLIAGNRVTIDANAVIRATLAPFMSDATPRIHIDGPALQLSEEFGCALALAVHELATNAIKYGALSVAGGTVTLTWSTKPVPEGDRFDFEWKERGGPPPSPPAKEGFGSRLIKSVTAREKSGNVALDYEPDGLRCRISAVRQANRPSAATT